MVGVSQRSWQVEIEHIRNDVVTDGLCLLLESKVGAAACSCAAVARRDEPSKRELAVRFEKLWYISKYTYTECCNRTTNSEVPKGIGPPLIALATGIESDATMNE
jgi:hypothetical protein